MSHSRGVYFEGDGWCLFTGFSTKRCRLNNVFALETRHIFGRIPHKITIIQSLKRYTQPASEQRAVKQFKILQIHSNIFLLLFLCGHSLFNQSPLHITTSFLGKSQNNIFFSETNSLFLVNGTLTARFPKTVFVKIVGLL